VGGQVVGVATANGGGAFSSTVTPPTQGAGQVTITAACGSKRFVAVVSVVATSGVSAPEGSAAVFGIFVLLGVVLVRGQFGGAASRRRRRHGAADIELD
jgi:hypothetical protein